MVGEKSSFTHICAVSSPDCVMNFYNDHDKVVFEKVYSDDMNEVRRVMNAIHKVWNTENAYGIIYIE